MRPKCILVAGSERRFIKSLRQFETYLCAIGCDVEFYTLPDLNVLKAISSAARSSSRDQPFLLVYDGHGSPWGWEGNISYLSLLWSLLKVKGELLVLNDTCYGYRLLNYLKLIRCSKNTCFISPWDSDDVSYGGAIRDALTYWPKGIIPENVFSEHIYSSEKGDREVPIQLRWGAALEHRFFPA